MQFGVHVIGAGPMADPGKLVMVAQKAEALGYHSLWLSDHIGYLMTVGTVLGSHQMKCEKRSTCSTNIVSRPGEMSMTSRFHCNR